MLGLFSIIKRNKMEIFRAFIESVLVLELFFLIMFLKRSIRANDNLAERLEDKKKMYDFCIHQLDQFKKKLDEMKERLEKF